MKAGDRTDREPPEVALMHLELSALYQLELSRAFDADRRREQREALRRGARFEAAAAAESTVVRVPFGYRAGRRGDPAADVGRVEHLDPAPCREQHTGRLVRAIQSQPEP